MMILLLIQICFDIPPPENDHDAVKLGNEIREWIKNDRIEPDQPEIIEKINDESEDTENDFQKHDKEEKPKKKRGLFGFFKK